MNKYEKIQTPAVEAIVKDFSAEIEGRYLLVIPTGGGKTRTAAKSVIRLLTEKVIEHNKKILWVAHRDFLLGQAKDAFNQENVSQEILSRINFCMLSQAASYLRSNSDCGLIVLDEAHHSKETNVTYAPLLNSSSGILGLTATPARTDNEPMGFERASYSIGFPELIRHGIVMKPEIISRDSGLEFLFERLEKDSLDLLNSEERNQFIVDVIEEQEEQYTKVVIFVGTTKHAEDLWRYLKASSLSNLYDQIEYVTGDHNSLNVSRDEFLSIAKASTKSIIINIDVLTEGYDDPSINTVVMARPTNSKLFYMQAVGRAIRFDPENYHKKAYILEINDRTPNIRYQIDNRWLYSELPDTLEPVVFDHEYADESDLRTSLADIYSNYSVIGNVPKFDFSEYERYSLVLFKIYAGKGAPLKHIPLFVSNENRQNIIRMFTALTKRAQTDYEKSIPFHLPNVKRLVDNSVGKDFISNENLKRIYESMIFAAECITNNLQTDWIKFFSYRLNQDERLSKFEDFLAEVVNKDALLDRILGSHYTKGSVLVKFPLPLNGYIGTILSTSEMKEIDATLNSLSQMIEKNSLVDNRSKIRDIISDQNLPVEPSLAATIPHILRYNLDYKMDL